MWGAFGHSILVTQVTVEHDRYTRALSRTPLRRGDVVAAVGGNSLQIWSLLKATEDLGLALAVINRSTSPEGISRLLDKLGAQLALGYGQGISGTPAAALVDGVIGEDGSIDLPDASALGPRRARTDHGLRGSVEGAVIFSTSGSTGEPKCVVSSLENRRFSTRVIGEYLRLEAGQTIVNAFPPSFDYGFYQGLLAEMFGLELRQVSSPLFVGEVIEQLPHVPRIVLPLTPAMAARLTNAVGDAAYANVETVSLTGGGTALGLRRRLAEVFPKARIYAMYGLTECKRVGFLDPDEFLSRPRSCGKAMDGVTATVMDPEGRPVPRGEIGELVISGDNVCLGYWGDAAATAAVYRPGPDGSTVVWTGDRFREDEDGYLEFVGRADRQVKLRDERVSLAQIEGELRRSPLALDLFVVVEDDELGIPQLVASVVPADPATSPQEILKSFRPLVSRPSHLPVAVRLQEGLALNQHGKRDATVPAAEQVQTSLT